MSEASTAVYITAYLSAQDYHHFFSVSLLMTKGCKYLKRGRCCYSGCTANTTMCHKFARGKCHVQGLFCENGYHYKPEETPSARTRARGDGFRPYVLDGADEVELKKHLATLMLNTECENLIHLDAGIVMSMYRKIALKIHPDKNDGRHRELFNQLGQAKDYVLARLPFHIETEWVSLE